MPEFYAPLPTKSRYLDIADSLGFALVNATPHDSNSSPMIEIRHKQSGNSIVLSRDDVEKLFDFLNICKLETTNKLLEERIARLEEAVFAGSKDSMSNVSAHSTSQTSTETISKLEKLKIRAETIGTSIYENKDEDGYIYIRPRFKIPGTHYKFYFTVENAFQPQHPRRRNNHYYFKENELALLEKWVEYDEQIYAQYNSES